MARPRLRLGPGRPLLWPALVLVASACGPARLVRQGWDPGTGIEGVLQVAAAELNGLDDLSAEARVVFAEPAGKGTATAFITYKRPSRFRVDLRGPFYSHLLTALLDGDSLIVVARGRTWRGAARDGLVGPLLEVDLGDYPLPYAFLGIVHPGDPDSAASSSREDPAVAVLRGGGLTRRLWVDVDRGFVTREEVYVDDSLAWLRLLRRYRRLGRAGAGLYLPREVVIRQGERTLELSYVTCAANQGIPDSSFRRGIP